jgi:hypothetical protein
MDLISLIENLANSLNLLVPPARLELARRCRQQILSLFCEDFPENSVNLLKAILLNTSMTYMDDANKRKPPSFPGMTPWCMLRDC